MYSAWYLGDGLGEGAAGLVADPYFLFGAHSSADGLQLGVDYLVGRRLNAHVRPARRVQLQVLADGWGGQTLMVHEESTRERET